MKVLLFLNQLDAGGAERQFVQTASGLADRGHKVSLVTRLPGGALAGDLDQRVAQPCLFRGGGGLLVRAARLVHTPARLARLVAEERPDVVYSALYFPNMQVHRALGGSSIPLVSGLRTSGGGLDARRQRAFDYGRRHAADFRLAIFNSHAARDWHVQQGFRFPAERIVPNGIDTAAFVPDSTRGHEFRRRWKIPDEAFLVGIVARLVAEKDHATFLEAAARFGSAEPAARFVVVGGGPESALEDLRAQAARLGLTGRVVFTGSADPRAAYAAMDLVASTSRIEGFPNVLAEALACGTPCAATDVGDSARIVGEEGAVVPAGDAEGMAEAWHRLHALGREHLTALGEEGRARIARQFGLEACTRKTEEALRAALG